MHSDGVHAEIEILTQGFMCMHEFILLWLQATENQLIELMSTSTIDVIIVVL